MAVTRRAMVGGEGAPVGRRVRQRTKPAPRSDVPFHEQYEEKHGKPIPAPPCSSQGIRPWVKSDGTRNTVHHVRVPDSVTRVSDVIKTSMITVDGVMVTIDLLRGRILALEADCNLGKSFAVLLKLLHPLLEANPRLPLLFISVRIAHAHDLYATLRKTFMEGDNRIPGVDIRCYEKSHSAAGTTLTDRVGHSQLVLSLESMQKMSADAVQKLVADLRNGVVVYDELHSAAQNHGTTDASPLVSAPAKVTAVLRRVNGSAEFVVAMDRDLTLTPIPSLELALIAPELDVLHVQFDAPGQPDRRFCYTATAKRHEKSGRGAPCATAHLRLQVETVRASFETTPDDGSRKGPNEWKRLFIGCDTSKKGEALVQQLRAWGVKTCHMKFYNGNIGENKPHDGDTTAAVKADLLDTTPAWRDVWVIIATPTITVAVNPELPFHACWLFVHCAQSLEFVKGEANQLMQLMARLPRGSLEAQRAQLTDHRIWVQFDGDFPALEAPKQITDAGIQASSRELAEVCARARVEDTLAAEAHRDLRDGSTASVARAPLAPLQKLRGANDQYRRNHVGAEYVYRYFEIAEKSGFGEHEQMPLLTQAEQVQLLQLVHGVDAAGAENILEVLRVGGDAEAEAALTPAQHKRRWQILLGVLERETFARAGGDDNGGEDEARAGDVEAARRAVRDGFCRDDCNGLAREKENLTAVDKLKKDVYFTLQPFDLASLVPALRLAIANGALPDGELSDGTLVTDARFDRPEPFFVASLLDTLPQFREIGEASAGSFYAALHPLRRTLERLARFRHLTLAEVRDEMHWRSERADRVGDLSVREGAVCAGFHELAELLGVPLTRLLEHGAVFVATGEQGTVAPWIDAHNRLCQDDNSQRQADDRRLQQVRTLVKTTGADAGRGLACMKHVGKVAERVLALVGLGLEYDPPVKAGSGGKMKPIRSVTVREGFLLTDLGGLSLADGVQLFCPAAARSVRADAYRSETHLAAHWRNEGRAALGISPPPSPASRPPSPQRTGALTYADPSAEVEVYHAEGVTLVLTTLNATEARRKKALSAVKNLETEAALALAAAKRAAKRAGSPPAELVRLQAELVRLQADVGLRSSQRKTLLRAEDMRHLVAVLDAAPRDADGEIVQTVTYDQPRGLGRQIARAPCKVQAHLLDQDEAFAAQHGMQRELARSVCYQGMHNDLRPVLGADRLHDVDIAACFPTVIVNHARRMDCLDQTPTVHAYVNDPKSFRAEVARFHSVDPKDAKALLNKLVCGGSYSKWLSGLAVRSFLALTPPLRSALACHPRARAPLVHARSLRSCLQPLLSTRFFSHPSDAPQPSACPAQVEMSARVEMPKIRAFIEEVSSFRNAILERDAAMLEGVQADLVRERPGDDQASIARSVWAIWLQNEENTVLALMVKRLRMLGWHAMAKIFDGLLAERRPNTEDPRVQQCLLDCPVLRDALDDVQGWLLTQHDWDVKLVEKPLHEWRHDRDWPIRTVAEADEVMREVLSETPPV